MIKPLGARLLINPVDPFAEELDDGIVTINHDVPQSLRGEVIAIGGDVTLFKVGDTVLYSQFAPTQAQEKSTDKYVIVPEQDVLAVIA